MQAKNHSAIKAAMRGFLFLAAAIVLCLFAACSSENNDDTETVSISAEQLAGTTWTGTANQIPLTLTFDSTESKVTIVVTVMMQDITLNCTYEISGGNSITATCTDEGTHSGATIAMTVTSYTGSTLNVSVESATNTFQAITSGTTITFTKTTAESAEDQNQNNI